MTKFEQFAKEKRYLLGVSPRTLEWYEQSLRWLNTEQPSEQDLKDTVLRMREAGLKASSCNCRIRAINSYLTWAQSAHRIPRLKEPVRVLPVFSPQDIQLFLRWKPRTINQRRLQLFVCLLADTGVRVDEALSLKWMDVNLDDLLLKVDGKGARQRQVPFSFELRKLLWKHRHDHPLVFVSGNRTKLGRRDMLRDVKRLCRDLGIKAPERTLHAARHSMATTYIQRGGSVAMLQRVLGHSNISTTMRYVHLQTQDLQKIHQQLSLLS